MIAELRETGCAIRLITDGDVAGVIHCAEARKTGIDMYMGSLGGAPEGVLAAAALEMHGWTILWSLTFPQQRRTQAGHRAQASPTLIASTHAMNWSQSDVIFAATGVTDGSILAGTRQKMATLWKQKRS